MKALLYLIRTSARNRLTALVKRTRSPRYAAALAVGVFYIWLFLLRPANSSVVAPALLNKPTETIVTLLAVLTLMGSWVFGADATALAFSQAEVSLLFTAPLSRRTLIAYKLFRAQIAVLINALIWVFVLRRGGAELPAPLRAVSLWMLFSTLNFHRLGAALVRTSWREHGKAGAWRHRWSIAVFALIGGALLISIVASRARFAAASGMEFFTALSDALSSAPASWALFPFHLVVAPTFAHTFAQWNVAIVYAVVMLGVHAWWVLQSDTAFEEAAVEASAERAKRLESMRARRSVTGGAKPRAATTTWALASTGHPAMAILWKNALCLRRTVQLRLFVGPTVMAAALGAAMASEGSDMAGVIATSAAAFAVMLIVFGGRLIRNDLRQDMRHLELLKSLPIAPADLMLAEVASAAIPVAALQLVLLIIAYAAAGLSASPPLTPQVRLALLVAAPFAVLALNGALLTIQNGTAVLFPAWIRLGPSVSTGVEALGQNVLATIANLFSLAVALVIPALIGFATVHWLGRPPAVGLSLLIVVAAVILGAETFGILRLLGRALARAEPGQTI